jgi:hypothetical protein
LLKIKRWRGYKRENSISALLLHKCARISRSVLPKPGRDGASLPITALVDTFYSEIEKMRGKHRDTSGLLARLES